MKKAVIITSLLMGAFLLIRLFTHIGCVGLTIRYYNIPEFETEYSEEEHLERVKEIAEKKIPKKYLVDIKTEILYAYYRGTPEYVLITVELAEEISGEIYGPSGEKYPYDTKYLHAVVRIYEDEYYDTHIKRNALTIDDWQLPYWLSEESSFVLGANPYQVCGYGEEYKKYYMNKSFATERNGKIMEFYEFNGFDDAVYTLGLEPYDFSEKEVSLKTQKSELVESYRNQYYTSQLYSLSKFS